MGHQNKAMNILKKFAYVGLVLLCEQLGAAENPYTLADLKALDEQGSYQELLGHLNDVRPTDRKGEWLALAERAAVKTLDTQLKSEDAAQAIALSEQILTMAPQLKKSAEFMKKRAEAGIKGFAQCFRYGSDECSPQLKAFIDQDPDNRSLAFEAGKLVRLNMQHSAALPFFISAVKDGKDKAYCGDADVVLAVESGMGMTGERADQAKQLAFSLCYDALKPKLLALLYKSQRGGAELKNLCAPLLGKKVLSEFQIAYCKD